MGLDSVELVLEVEETFGFSIPDEDAAGLNTVGKLYDYILAHRFEDRLQGCLTSVAFYRLRRALMSTLGMSRADVHVSLDLAAAIRTRRRQRWSDLQRALGLRLPELVRPVWVTAIATVVGCVLVIVAAVYFAAIGLWGATALTLGVTCFVAHALYQVTQPLAIAFRPEFATVGGLAKVLLCKNYGTISDQCQRANAQEAWNTLRTLIAEQRGMRVDDVTKEASFVKDLGMD